MGRDLMLALAQLNPVLGDIAGNIGKLRAVYTEAVAKGARLLMVPELFLCGYPPEDLVLKPSFQKAIRDAVVAFAVETRGQGAVLVGAPWVVDVKLYNAFLLLADGGIAHTVLKYELPNYGPFDEKRVFASGPLPEPFELDGVKFGLMICEDMWRRDVTAHLARRGAEILLVPNGSPYETGKQQEREELARARVKETGLPLIYLNQVGGQDELVFDGASFVLDKNGACVSRMKAWQEDMVVISPSRLREGLGVGLDVGGLTQNPKDCNERQTSGPPSIQDGESKLMADSACRLRDKHASGREEETETIYNALILGLRDYVNKNGFPGVVLGLSGGIDSALVAALAADALGADKLWCVMLPSPYTSRESHEDAAAIAKNLGCRYDTLPIEAGMQSFDAALSSVFAGKAADVTEENIQARCRGLMLMALSNKFGPMVVSTGNKSEMSVGYSTLYGDLCGGFAPLKDVYKTQVYKLTAWRNKHKPAMGLGPSGAVIPERVLTKAPTAELRPNQKDQDSLPPYEALDDILECMIEHDMGKRKIVARGHDAAIVARVWAMLDRAEYKRRQAPPGVKITRRILGRDRRYPITNGYRETD